MFAYFAHRATPLEKQQIEAWLKTEEGAEAYFTYLDEWERQFPQFQANLDDARQKFSSFMQEQPETPYASATGEQPPVHTDRETEVTQLKPFYGWVAAASVILLAGLWLFKPVWYYRTLSSGNNRLVSVTLDDGSEVVLGANSSLRYPRYGFNSQVREVWLEGDAEFRVEHLPDGRRFNVHTAGEMVIEVLGTEFVVNNRLKTTRVMLKTGSIRLTHPVVAQPVLMEPGDLVTISSEQKIYREKLPDKAGVFSWKVLDFEFKDTPLKMVARQLQTAYGVKVEIDQPEIAARTVSGSFSAETAEDLLDAIAEMMGLTVEKTPKGYVIRK